MGISGLLPFVKKASRPCFLREFSGSVAAVDTYCWLHKGAFSCAEQLVRGEDTDGYVVYVMKMVRLLLSHRIKPIMVFDGCNLPSKAGTESKRRESRAKNRALAKELLREGRTREARECFQRCVDVTSRMARAVMAACRKINVDVIVAPYEADAQLAYLTQAGFADLIITEDSDLILFGCERVIFKLDNSGGGVLVEQDKLHLAMGIPSHKFSLETFRHMCVLSGCDYLPSLPGIGLAKACKFFTLTSNTDVFNALCKLPSYLKMPQLEVPLEYREGFRRAVFTFLHQLVFCPRDRRLRPLTEPDDGSEPSDHPYAGAFMGHERALQIALGNIDVQTSQQVEHFDPDRHKAPAMKSSGWCASGDKVAEYSSIWQPDYDRNAFRERCAKDRKPGRGEGLSAFVANDTRRREKVEKGGGVGLEKAALNSFKEKKSTKQHGQVKKVMDIKSLFAKRKREIDEEASNGMSDLLALYHCPTKTPKTEDSDIKPSSTLTPQRALKSQGEASPTQNMFAKYRRSPSKNPFAKKKLDDSDHGLKTENSSTLEVEDNHPVGNRDLDSNEEALQDTISLLNCPTTRLKCDPDFKSEDDADILLEDDSGICDTETIKGKENDCETAVSCVAAEERRTTTSNSLTDVNMLASLRGQNIILKSKYFRPAGSAPAPSPLKSDSVEVVLKASDGGRCTTEDESTANDNTSSGLGSSQSTNSSAALSTSGSDKDNAPTTYHSSSTRRRGSGLSSSALSRRFSFQSTNLEPASSSDDKQDLPVNDRVGSPTPNSGFDPNVCDPGEATLRPSSPILSRRTSFKTRGRKSLSLSQEQSAKEASARADGVEYSEGSGRCAPGNDVSSGAPCSEGVGDSQASVEGSSVAKGELSQRSCRSELLDDSCDEESFGLTPLRTVEKPSRDLDSMETCDLVTLSSSDEGDDHDGNEEKAERIESRKKSQSQDTNIPTLVSLEKSQTRQKSESINLTELKPRSNSADTDSDVAMQSSIEEESPYQTNSKQSQDMSAEKLAQSSGEENDLVEVCDDLPAELLGKTVSPALIKQQREILKALENTDKPDKTLRTSTQSSPYFSTKPPASASKPGSCRRPGLSKPPKGGRQLNLRDMFSLKR